MTETMGSWKALYFVSKLWQSLNADMFYISDLTLKKVFICMAVITLILMCPSHLPFFPLGLDRKKTLKHVPFFTVIPDSHRPLPVVKIFETALKAASVCIFSFVNDLTCKFTK